MYSISRKGFLQGEIIVPGSKSHTIRAVLLAAMAEGRSVIHNPLTSGDGLSALKAARALGAEITEEAGVWIVEGRGKKLHVPENYIDTFNSGTTTSFVTSISALLEGYTFITGDQQIRRRPIKPLTDALIELGAQAFLTRPGSAAPPVVIGGKMRGGRVYFDGFNSQFISSILLSAPLAEGDTEIFVENPLEKPYIQMTLDWMKLYGATPSEVAPDFKYFAVKGNQSYRAVESHVPSDWSGAAFPLVAAVTTPSEVVISGVDFNDSQGDKAVVDHLIAMGADIVKDFENRRMIIKGGAPLHGGVTIDLNDTPDALPALSVAACFAEGKTTFTNLAHVRVKETDRVAVMEKELKKLGADIETGPDYMTVNGGRTLTGAEVDSHDDHRVAMALTAAGLFAAGETRVKDAQCASVSFPGFYELMNKIGAGIILRD